MTKKDYILLAEVIKNRRENSVVSYLPLAIELSDRLKTDNPLHDTERFLLACGFTKCRECEEIHDNDIMHLCPENR